MPSGWRSSARSPGGCSTAPGYGGALLQTGDLDAAIDGASFVLFQIRVGGQAARLRDETVPLRCGCIGQETTGAGGFAKAMRTVPVILELAERVADARRTGRLDRRFHEPGRDRHPRAARRRPSGRRALQRRDHASSARSLACSTSTPERVARRPGRAEPPDLDPRRSPRRPATCSRSSSSSTATSWPRRSSCRAACSTTSACFRPITCTTSTRTTACSRSS